MSLLLHAKGSPLHPQWLADRFHALSRRKLKGIGNATILDIGSGSSRHEVLAGKNNLVFRLDYPITSARYLGRPDIYGNACELPIRATSVDVVLLLEVLEHVSLPDRALAEIRRVLKPSGKLYLSVPFIYPIHDAPYDYRRFTPYGIRDFLCHQGFQIVAETHHGNSVVTVIQMVNLVLLEVVHDLFKKTPLIGITVGLIVYPVCLFLNILASPLLFFRWPTRACLGYFIVAERRATT